MFVFKLSVALWIPQLAWAAQPAQFAALAAPTFTCPGSNGTTVTNVNGIKYNLRCSSDTYGSDLSHGPASKSFNDCFALCDSTKNCGGFTYVGAVNGAGTGNCYLKNGTMKFQGGTQKMVSAILAPASMASKTVTSSVVPATSKLSSSSKTSSSTSVPSATPTYVRNNGKRGLAYNNDSMTLGFALSGQNSQVSWSYDWSPSPYNNGDNIKNPAITFIPLLFNDNEALAQSWPAQAQAAINGGVNALMSFNEPDLCYDGSACMTVNQSVAAYKRSMMPFAGKARLGAPAVTDAGSPMGLTYLSYFMGNCTGCQVDFINIHWYNNAYAFSYLQYYVQNAYKQFGLPIWLTEFGFDSSSNPDAQKQTFLQQALPWLDAVPYVERYAFFFDAPGYLINANGSGLSPLGTIYNSYTAACPNWNNTNGSC